MNATQAEVRAGYSKRTAYSQGQSLLKNVEIQNAVKNLREQIQNENIATIKDIEEFLSLCMLGDADEEVVLTVGNGEGYSKIVKERKEISLKDRIKAAELLDKRYGIWTDKKEISGQVAVQIIDDISLKEN